MNTQENTVLCTVYICSDFFSTAADRDVDANEKELVGNEDLQSNTVLHMAAWNNDIKTAELCLDNGADVNSLKCNSVTALHLAASKGNLEMAEFLISRGAGVNMKDEDSKTPLHRYVEGTVPAADITRFNDYARSFVKFTVVLS